MKKIFTFLLVACFSVTLSAQTIVSTTPSNKNFILEEYTGTNCGYCPDGHKIASQIMAKNPGRAWAINIHQGYFSGNNPDYKTDWGDALANQYSISSYPIGTCNRGSSALGRGSWASQCTSILAQSSPVNVAAQGTINWNTRHLTLLVEVYYTGNAANSTNKLNVALMQNNILGPQSGMNLFPEMIVNNQYRHMHMLRDLITGQWGVDITTTSTGSFWSTTIQYDIPEHVRSVPIELDDLEIIVFVAENQKTILTGASADLTYTNLPALNPRFTEMVGLPAPTCLGDVYASVKIKNAGANPITSVEVTSSVAGGTPNTYIWNLRSIPSLATDTILVPCVVQIGLSQSVKVDLIKVNNTSVPLVTKTITITKTQSPVGDYSMQLVIKTDAHPDETSYKIFNPDGTILAQGTTPTPNFEHVIDFIPIMEGCQRVEVYDSQGDGSGYVKILKSNGGQIFYSNGQYDAKLTTVLTVDQFTVTASAGAHGTISPVGTEDYLAGTKVEYTFTPDQGYLVEDILIDDTPMKKPYITNYILTVDKDHTIHVKFKEAAYFTITASAGENGTISPEGEKEYMESTDAVYTFTPNEDYVVEEVYIDDKPMNMPLATSYTFTTIVKDSKIRVTFKKAASFIITASAGEHGTISPAGEIEYMEGESAEFIFTPNANYEVEEVFIDDQPMGMAQVTSYKFPVVDKDYKIHVTFKYIMGIKDINGVTIAVAPNPVHDKLFVTGTYDKLEIYSVAGQILTTAFNQPAIDVNNLAKGIYFVKIQTNGQTCTFKVVK